MRPQLGVCYYPEHWPRGQWQQDAQRMRATGLQWVRIGEFSWSQLEAREGKFTWDWLDHAIAILGQAGLRIVLGTPSATPPRWLISKYPEMLALDAGGNPRKFGSRRHYCFSHAGYREAAARMAEAMAKRYANNPNIHCWQIDNEYGCHQTTLSFSPNAAIAFREWLARRYGTIAALNNAWGSIFWSMQYSDFTEIDLPNLTVTTANPSHWLDFRRFSSDQVLTFNQAQVKAVRRYSDRPLIHNYMGRTLDFDHFQMGADLDIASWDSYPLGFLEQVVPVEDSSWQQKFYRQGDPDFQAFHHDLYRAVGQGRMWVMEQQPGPVNWARFNPIPLPGMVKLWTMEAIAHGAEVVSYFRWRQLAFGQEQMHAGLLQPDGSDAPGQAEVHAAAKELAAIGEVEQVDAEVAIVFDYSSQWAWEIQPQGAGFDYFRLVFEQYRALRKLGLNVDLLPVTTSDFGQRKLVLIPGLLHWTAALRQAIGKFTGYVVAGPRTGSKTADMHIATNAESSFAGAQVLRVASLRPNTSVELVEGGKVINWFEELATSTGSTKTIVQSSTGQPILVQQQQRLYLAAWLDQPGYLRIFTNLARDVGIDLQPVPEGVRIRSVKGRKLITNYNAFPVTFANNQLPASGYCWQ